MMKWYKKFVENSDQDENLKDTNDLEQLFEKPVDTAVDEPTDDQQTGLLKLTEDGL